MLTKEEKCANVNAYTSDKILSISNAKVSERFLDKVSYLFSNYFMRNRQNIHRITIFIMIEKGNIVYFE